MNHWATHSLFIERTRQQISSCLALVLFIVAISYVLSPSTSLAQTNVQNKIDLPSGYKLFEADSKDYKKNEKKVEKSILTRDAMPSDQVDFKAPSIEYQKDSNLVSGKDGIVISGMGVQIEADQGTLNMKDNTAQVSGRVLVTQEQGSIASDEASFNIEEETGGFKNAEFVIDEENYHVKSESVEKLTETKYKLFNSSFTTCDCADSATPWSFSSEECRITQEGYAHAYGTTMRLFGTPILYTPWLGFPAKIERASGLLAPTIGYDGKHGFQARVPVYVVLDDSTDMTLSPFTETKTRDGSFFDFRKVFSNNSKSEGRFLYSDERPRNGDLQGTDITGVYDPTIDDDRFGAYYSQQWVTEPEAPVRMGLYSDIHYVSDDLLLREIDDNGIGDRQLPFTTSRVSGRAELGEYVNSEVAAEYNQSFVSDDDLMLQRLPEAQIVGMKSFRPFGFNPYGLKLVTKGDVTTTNFIRTTGYDGLRTNVAPTLAIPFHYQNYFYSVGQVELDQTWYNMNNRYDPATQAELASSADRLVTQASYTISTAVERVYQLEEGNLLSQITSLGTQNQDVVLSRVKHVIEPTLSYTYIPKVAQDDLPSYDYFDRIREKSLFSYALNTSLVGRFLPRKGSQDGVVELTPRVEDMPTLGVEQGLDDIYTLDQGHAFGTAKISKGEIRELTSFTIKQSYDRMLDKDVEQNVDSTVHPWSDLGAILGIYPTKHFGLYFDTNFNQYEGQVSSWSLASSLRDDRGDTVRGRYTYFRDSVSQLEANLEMVLTDRVKVGYYTKYDDIEEDFIENYVALRLTSACDCWHFDIGMRDTLNPDKQVVLFSINLGGLGGLSQNVLLNRAENQQ